MEPVVRMAAAQTVARFRAARVARLATVNASGEPHLVPVTFAVLDGIAGGDGAGPVRQASPGARIVFAVDHKPKSTTALRRVANIAANPRVAFLVDEYDEDWERLWWVRADGIATIADGVQRVAALTALAAKYPQYRAALPDGIVVVSAVEQWRGWQAGSDRGEA